MPEMPKMDHVARIPYEVVVGLTFDQRQIMAEITA
jgi:hypothetical protein